MKPLTVGSTISSKVTKCKFHQVLQTEAYTSGLGIVQGLPKKGPPLHKFPIQLPHPTRLTQDFPYSTCFPSISLKKVHVRQFSLISPHFKGVDNSDILNMKPPPKHREVSFIGNPRRKPVTLPVMCWKWWKS